MKTSEIKELFDEIEAEQLKRAGMERAAAHPNPLQLARDIAEELAITGNGCCDADQVARVLKEAYGISLGPSAGALFRGQQWQFTGQWLKSDRKSNHGRMIREWRLV